jgi:hypothetical protein
MSVHYFHANVYILIKVVLPYSTTILDAFGTVYFVLCMMRHSLLTVAGQGRLRIFGNGQNRCSFTHVDNYCHGLILGYDALTYVYLLRTYYLLQVIMFIVAE